MIKPREIRTTITTSGKYLIDMDGSFSINELQRLPGKKLAISFNGSTINVNGNGQRIIDHNFAKMPI
ncbi:hypothetical protein [Aliivibrio wodanis]|uniref:hypothetical protein n=1 Tax=Aliivibrio wodanis TaxID=80852 RepID=UPI00406CB77B